MFQYHENYPHWWVKGADGQVYDLTAAQFESEVAYSRAVAKGFLTRRPSKRSQIVIDRVMNGSG